MENSVLKTSLMALFVLAVCRIAVLNVHADLAPVPDVTNKTASVWPFILIAVIVIAAIILYLRKAKSGK